MWPFTSPMNKCLALESVPLPFDTKQEHHARILVQPVSIVGLVVLYAIYQGICICISVSLLLSVKQIQVRIKSLFFNIHDVMKTVSGVKFYAMTTVFITS